MHDILVQIAVALAFNLLDLITGFIGALRTHSLQSSKMRDGMFKKVGFVFCYIIGVIIDRFGAEIGIKLGISILPIIITYAIVTELTSICENINTINPDLLSSKLMEMFHVKHLEGSDNNEDKQ